MKTENYDELYLNTCLKAMIGSDLLVEVWWNTYNLAFDGKTPRYVYLLGPEGRSKVTNYILGHVNGDYY